MAKAKKPARAAVVRWKFDDGHFDQPLAQFEEQLLRQAAAKLQSDDPVLRLSGKRELQERADRLAAGTVTAAKRAKATAAAAEKRRAKGRETAEQLRVEKPGQPRVAVSQRHARRIIRGK